MKTVIIVSECLDNQDNKQILFNFKGSLNGYRVRQVVLSNNNNLELSVGLTYLMYAEISSIKDGLLIGSILKAKLVPDEKTA